MKYSWDLKHLYKNEKCFEKDFETLKLKLNDLAKTWNSILKNKNTFINTLELAFETLGLGEKLYCYVKRNFDANNQLIIYEQKAENVLNVYNQTLSYFNKITLLFYQNKNKVLKYVEDTDFKRVVYLILRKEKHNLKENNIEYAQELNNMLKSFQKIYNSLILKDLQDPIINLEGTKIILDAKNYNNLIINKDPVIRKLVYNSYLKHLLSVKNTLATLYDNKLTQSIKLAKLHQFKSIKDRVLFEEELPDNIINFLIKSAHKYLYLNNEYIKIKKDVLNLQDFHIYDNLLPLSSNINVNFSIKESIDILKKAYLILGTEYVEKIDLAFKEGWIDLYNRPNKRKDSYSCICYFGVPYTSLNYDNTINSLKTLGHELGHAIHTHFSKKQKFYNFEYSIFTSEITSKVNELLLYEYLIENTQNKDKKIYYLNSIINFLINNLFEMIKNTEFEDIIINKKYNNEIITADILDQEFAKLNLKYYGSDVISEDISKSTWIKNKFWWLNDEYILFKYATGLGIATSIVYNLKINPILKDKYIEFLSIGNSMSITDALKILEIDLNEYKYIDNAFKLLEEKIILLKSLLKK